MPVRPALLVMFMNLTYFFKKLAALICTLFLISIVTFVVFQIIPGDPALTILGTEATDEAVAALEEELGLNDPLPVRYANWLLACCGEISAKAINTGRT